MLQNWARDMFMTGFRLKSGNGCPKS